MRGTVDLEISVRGAQDGFVTAIHGRRDNARSMLRLKPALAFARSRWGESAMEAASHLGDRELLCNLVGAGVELDLFAACAMAHIAEARRLLGGRPRDIRGIHGLPLLHFGIVSGDQSIVHMLIDEGAPVNPRGAAQPPLHSAVAAGSGWAVKVLLRAGAEVGAIDVLGETALELALMLDGPRSPMADLLRGVVAYDA